MHRTSAGWHVRSSPRQAPCNRGGNWSTGRTSRNTLNGSSVTHIVRSPHAHSRFAMPTIVGVFEFVDFLACIENLASGAAHRRSLWAAGRHWVDPLNPTACWFLPSQQFGQSNDCMLRDEIARDQVCVTKICLFEARKPRYLCREESMVICRENGYCDIGARSNVFSQVIERP